MKRFVKRSLTGIFCQTNFLPRYWYFRDRHVGGLRPPKFSFRGSSAPPAPPPPRPMGFIVLKNPVHTLTLYEIIIFGILDHGLSFFGSFNSLMSFLLLASTLINRSPYHKLLICILARNYLPDEKLLFIAASFQKRFESQFKVVPYCHIKRNFMLFQYWNFLTLIMNAQ